MAKSSMISSAREYSMGSKSRLREVAFNVMAFVMCVGLAAFALLLSGCSGSGSPPLGKVEGIVTLNGQPLEGAVVEFQPSPGVPSFGRTDSQGRYRLQFDERKQGATLGSHRVSISSRETIQSDLGDETTGVERLPDSYNTRTTLTAKVERGKNEINFELTYDEREYQKRVAQLSKLQSRPRRGFNIR